MSRIHSLTFALAVLATGTLSCGGSDVPPTDPSEVPTQPPKNPPTREEELPQAPAAPTAETADVTGATVGNADSTEHGRDHAREKGNDRRDRIVEATSGWVRLGERWVEGTTDRDIMKVGKEAGAFRSILIGVEHSGLVLFDVIVTFENGEKFSPVTKLVFDEGAATRVIDLPGKARRVKQVEFKYGNLPGGGRAQVELWAK